MLELLRAIGGHSQAFHASGAFNQYECYVFSSLQKSLGFTEVRSCWRALNRSSGCLF